MSNKIYHIQVTLTFISRNHVMKMSKTIYYISLKPIVLSYVCNLNKYENLHITEMMFIYLMQGSFSCGVHFIE